MADTIGKIYRAIPAIMGELDAIGKNKRNQQQGFMYRGVDDVMNAINPSLVKNKVFIVPEIIDQQREERQTAKGNNLIYSICRMRFKFFAEDGSSVEAVTIGEGMDSGDKATNKAMAVAFKYACFQIFCIPTEEMKDPDAESHEVWPKTGDTKALKETDAQMNAEMITRAKNAPVDAMKVKVVKETIRKNGLAEASILNHYQLQSFDAMTVEQWTNAMTLLKRYQDKEENA